MSIADDSIQAIKEMIVSGELQPGDRLPTEPELAARLGVSRNSLREAVRALTVLRVLNTRQGAGTFVTSLAPELLLDAVGLVADLLTDETVLELVEVRRMLEPAATAMAAWRMSDADLAALERSLERLDRAETIDELMPADMEFHRIIVDGTGNSTLSTLMANLSGGTRRLRVWRGVSQEGAITQTKAEHHAIFNALKARDPDLARAAATMHLASTDLWLRSSAAADIDDEDDPSATS